MISFKITSMKGYVIGAVIFLILVSVFSIVAWNKGKDSPEVQLKVLLGKTLEELLY